MERVRTILLGELNLNRENKRGGGARNTCRGWGRGDTWVPLWEKLFLNCALGGAIHTRLVPEWCLWKVCNDPLAEGWGTGGGGGDGDRAGMGAGVREGQLALLLCRVTREI